MGIRVEPSAAVESVVRGVNTKRKILIVENNVINQEILTAILKSQYEVIVADNGAIGLELLKKHYRNLSLIMLDVYTPVCNGFELLEKVKDDSVLSAIPVIVSTGSDDPEDEVKCLKMGVYDFVTKPYNAEIVLARIEHIISLKESIAALSAVEYDSLTNLYTMQAFIHKVQKLLHLNPDKHFDLLLADIQDFKLVNDTFGEETGDEVLKEVARACCNVIPFYAGARDGDKFYFLCDCVDYLEREFVDRVSTEASANLMIHALSIKYGVYHDIDASLSVSILCDRVNIAVSSIKHIFNKDLAFYNESLREQLLENQKMEADFIPALENGEFFAWYQPKVDLRTGKIVGAEALVRWIPEMGKILSPVKFIPLFERNGQIADLDEYIFKQVCRFQSERLQQEKRIVPISVNLSRNSLYRSDIVSRYIAIARESAIPLNMVPLELTESAAMESRLAKQFVTQANQAGFEVHMDDFGTGYSSISSLTRLPFSVIKLDKSLIDQIGFDKGDIIMKYLIGAAHAIGMGVVAEGVETQSQVDFLKGVDCNILQGYYYSAPQNRTLFENMLDTNERYGNKT